MNPIQKSGLIALAAAATAMAAAAQALAASAEGGEVKTPEPSAPVPAAKPKPPAAKPAPPAAPKPEAAGDALFEAATRYAGLFGREGLAKVLKDLGAKTVSDIPEEKQAEALAIFTK